MAEAVARFYDRIKVDWHLFVPAFLISLAGLVTMDSFSGDNYYFLRQGIWILLAVVIFFIASSIDWRFLRRTEVLVPLYVFILLVLLALFGLGHVAKGAQRWISLGAFAFQPSDLAKLVIILVLAKYFSRRHIEIKNIRHIIVSGVYAFLVAGLVFLQPNFGTAIIISGIWLGMIMLSGVSKKHLLTVVLLGVASVAVLWFFALQPYQKNRIENFIHPLSDIHNSGYNAYQSTIAVGSGQILGKGIGQGSQSKLLFLPEYETDFIFAAFAEEWGFIGATLLLMLAVYLLWRIVNNASSAATNFETFFGLGFAILLSIHILVHAGMDMGFLPVTGIVFPFMSYGGSHLIVEWLSLGMLSSMTRHSLGPRTSRSEIQ